MPYRTQATRPDDPPESPTMRWELVVVGILITFLYIVATILFAAAAWKSWEGSKSPSSFFFLIMAGYCISKVADAMATSA